MPNPTDSYVTVISNSAGKPCYLLKTPTEVYESAFNRDGKFFIKVTDQSRMQAMPFLFTQHVTVASARGGYIRLNAETNRETI